MGRIGLAVVVAVSLALAPFSAEAQQAKRIPTVVLLWDDFSGLPPNSREAFVQGLRDLGCSAEKLRVAFVPADPLWLVQNRRAAEIGQRHRNAAIWATSRLPKLAASWRTRQTSSISSGSLPGT